MVLIEAATAGNEKEVEECAVVFKEHANKLVEVSKNVLSVELQTLKIDLLFFLGRIVCTLVLGKVITKTKQNKRKSKILMQNLLIIIEPSVEFLRIFYTDNSKFFELALLCVY